MFGSIMFILYLCNREKNNWEDNRNIPMTPSRNLFEQKDVLAV